MIKYPPDCFGPPREAARRETAAGLGRGRGGQRQRRGQDHPHQGGRTEDQDLSGHQGDEIQAQKLCQNSPEEEEALHVGLPYPRKVQDKAHDSRLG